MLITLVTHMCSDTYITLTALFGSRRDALHALTSLLLVFFAQLALLQLYGLATEQERLEQDHVRQDLGEVPRPSVLFREAVQHALNLTGHGMNDLDFLRSAHTPESVRAKTRSPAERISTIFERLRKKESCSFATSCQEER